MAGPGKGRFRVSADKLLLIAGFVWIAAGANILNIGLQASHGIWAIWMVGSAVLVFLAFHFGIFSKMVRKHTRRIDGYANAKTHVLRFFDRKSYLIMAFMMTVGIGLRVLGILPDDDIAFFYTGLGSALFIAGVGFLISYSGASKRHA
jgi:hypothetical protein